MANELTDEDLSILAVLDLSRMAIQHSPESQLAIGRGIHKTSGEPVAMLVWVRGTNCSPLAIVENPEVLMERYDLKEVILAPKIESETQEEGATDAGYVRKDP